MTKSLNSSGTSVSHDAVCIPKIGMRTGSILANVAINCTAASEVCSNGDALAAAAQRQNSEPNTALTLDTAYPMTLTYPTECDWMGKNCSMDATCVNKTLYEDNATSEYYWECKCKDGYIDVSPDPFNDPGIKCVSLSPPSEEEICKGNWIGGNCMSDGVRKYPLALIC